MNIKICARRFCVRGGAEQFLVRLARVLVARGHEVTVAAVEGDPVDGVALRRVPAPRRSPRHRRDWARARVLAREALRGDADVVVGEQKTWHAHVIRPGGGSEDDYWRHHVRYRWPGCRPPAWWRYLAPKRRLDLAAEQRGYGSPHLRRVIANSTMVRDQLRARYPALADRIEVVGNGVDLARFRPGDEGLRREIRRRHGLADDGLTVLFLGHDFRRKGLHFVLRALAQCRRRGRGRMQLLVVGQGRIRAYAERARRLGIRDAVRFAGPTEHPEHYYATADALALPTYYDACASAVPEALAAGLPVITTRANGAAALLTPGRNGWVLETPEAVDEMVRHLAALCDPARRAAMAAAARASVQDHALADKLGRIAEIIEASA